MNQIFVQTAHSIMWLRLLFLTSHSSPPTEKISWKFLLIYKKKSGNSKSWKAQRRSSSWREREGSVRVGCETKISIEPSPKSDQLRVRCLALFMKPTVVRLRYCQCLARLKPRQRALPPPTMKFPILKMSPRSLSLENFRFLNVTENWCSSWRDKRHSDLSGAYSRRRGKGISCKKVLTEPEHWLNLFLLPVL